MTPDYREVKPGLRARVPVTRVTDSPNKCVHSYYTMPVESADGRKIVFFEFDRPQVNRNTPTTLTGHLAIANADGSKMRHVAAMSGSPAQGATAQWVGATRRVAAVSKAGWLIVDTETGQEWRGPEHMRDVSPDGRCILCQTPEDIHLVAEAEGKTLSPDDVAMVGMDYETGEIDVRISLEDVLRVHPDAAQVRRQHMCFKQTLFSPSGQSLSFVLSNAWYIQHRRQSEAKRHELFMAGRHGESLRYLGPFGTHPGWAPDGEHLLAVADDASGMPRFMFYPAAGGAPRALGNDWLGGGHPSIQPVHQRYLCSDEHDSATGLATLRLFDLKTGAVEDILQAEYEDYSNESGTHLHPSWTRDGGSLHISSAHPGHSQLYRVDLA